MLYASVSTLSSSGSSPDLILREVEHLLHQKLSDTHYVTIVYAVLNLNTRMLSYVNAGHCPPLLLHENGEVESLAPTRSVLGLGLQDGFEPQSVRLKPGDRLALYTDGITEATCDGMGEFGSERVAEALLQAGALDPQQQHHSVVTQARTHANGSFTDDATLVLACVGNAARATSSKASA